MRRSDLAALDRWVAAGLVTSEQAAAIRSHEQAPPAAAPVGSRRALFAEVVGSLGALAAVVAAVVGVAQLWADLEPWARVVLPLIGAAVLLGAGAAVPARDERGLARLGALLFLFGIAGVVTSVVVLTFDVWEWDGQNVALAAGAVSLGSGAAVLPRRPEPHLVVAVAAGVFLVAVGLVSQYDHVRTEQVGVAVVAAALTVGLAGWSSLVPSAPTTYVVAAGGCVVGTMMVGSWSPPWAIGSAAVLALVFLALFMGEHHRTLLLGGLALALAALVRGVVELGQGRRAGGPDRAGLIATVFLAGVVLLAVAVWAVRHGPRSDGTPPGGRSSDAPEQGGAS